MLLRVTTILISTLAASAIPILSSVSCTGVKCDEPVCQKAGFDPVACGKLLTVDEILEAAYTFNAVTASCSETPTPLTKSYAVELPDNAENVLVTKAVATAAEADFPASAFIAVGNTCATAATENAAIVSGKTATFDNLTLDVTSIPGIVITAATALEDATTVEVTLTAAFATGTIPPPPTGIPPPATTVTVTAVTCEAECPDACLNAPIDLDTCLALIPSDQVVDVTYNVETIETVCAIAPNFGISIPRAGGIHAAKLTAAAEIPATSASAAQVLQEYTCAESAVGSQANISANEATFIFSMEPLPVVESQILAFTIGDATSPVSFSSAMVSIVGSASGTMAPPPASTATTLLALGTFSTAAYLATAF